jgi:hypothetical protein
LLRGFGASLFKAAALLIELLLPQPSLFFQI